MMTKFSTVLLTSLFISTPVFAGGNRTYQRGYSQEESCYRYEYREEYIPGTSRNPGYVKTHRDKVEVPCEHKTYVPQKQHQIDDNSCIEGSILGGILGGGEEDKGTRRIMMRMRMMMRRTRGRGGL